jgi:hypothetical protein
MTTADTVITLIDNNSVVMDTFTVRHEGTYGTLGVYYVKDYFSTVAEGVYFLKIAITFAQGGGIFYSEPLWLGTHADTIWLSYRHEYSIFDCKFGGVNLPMFYLRVPGGVKSDGFSPGGKFEMYNDLDHRPVMLQSQPFNLYKVLFGDSYGIPNWLADKINRAFALDYTFIDGVRYMRNEGAKMEVIADGNNPLSAWALECLLVDNPYSQHYTGQQSTIMDSGVWEDTKVVDDELIFSTDTTP